MLILFLGGTPLAETPGRWPWRRRQSPPWARFASSWARAPARDLTGHLAAIGGVRRLPAGLARAETVSEEVGCLPRPPSCQCQWWGMPVRDRHPDGW